MDLLFVEHEGCGYNADGGANLGLEAAVVTTDGPVEVNLPPGFGVSYSLSSVDDDDVPLREAAAATADGHLAVDVPEAGCHRLVVELSRGDLRGRFVSLLQTPEGSCPSR